MGYQVDFENVSTVGLESSPVAAALAGLRAHEARYFNRKHGVPFVVQPAAAAAETVDWVHRILRAERGIELSAPALEAAAITVDGIRWPHVYYQDGLAVNVLYSLTEGKRAVGFKLSEGMPVPAELAGFNFARMKSKLAGTIRGTYFVIKAEY